LPERFKTLQRLEQIGGDLLEIDFGIDVEDRLKIGGGEALASVLIEMSAKLGYAVGRQRETDGMGMASITGEQFAAGLERIEQVEGTNRTAGAVGLAIFAGQDQGRTAVALDYAGGGDADHSAMPAVTIDYNAVRV